MSSIQFPFGKTKVQLDLPDSISCTVINSSLDEYNTEKTETQILLDALKNPIGSASLEELSKGKENIVIITSDHTRPMPSKVTMPILLETIRKGNPNADITILVATGCHRETTPEELRLRFGDDIFKNEKIVVHDCDADNLADLGTLPSGNRLMINPLAAKADLLIAEGFIEPHFFAGYSGGRKSVLPGIAGRSTVMYNHNSQNINSPLSKTGVIQNNIIHKEMCQASERANLRFILNVILNSDKSIIAAFSGDPLKAHQEGINFYESLCSCEKPEADIVITTNGGYPLDQNIYQCVKGMSTADMVCKENGIIIMLGECSDGHGGKTFVETMKSSSTVKEILDEINARSPSDTIPDQWQAQILLKILLKSTVILVTKADKTLVESMHMLWASSVETALEQALEIKGPEASIVAIPNGVSTVFRQ